MKLQPILLLTMLLFCACIAEAQDSRKFQVKLASGTLEPVPNITPAKLKELDRSLLRVRNRAMVLVQFESIPDSAKRTHLKNAGIELHGYVSGNAFLATVRGELKADALKQLNARAVLETAPKQKMHPRLIQRNFPAWARRGEGRVELSIGFTGSFTVEEVKEELINRGFPISDDRYAAYRILSVVAGDNRLEELAGLPFVEYVQVVPGADQPLNDKSRANSRASVLQSTGPGGRGLSGAGVVLGIGDDGTPLRHIDLVGRAYNHSFSGGGAHGVHVMGTMAGGGIMDERYQGYAPRSRFVAQIFSNILLNTPGYINDYKMVITNNSYGNVVDDCESFGVYDLYSRVIDQQLGQYPFLMHVFAAGNSGTYECNGYSAGYGNVLGGYQSAKNAISVANTWEYGLIASSSSRGPVRDGRIKPEIAAQGTRVTSTGLSNNNYVRNNGTSMAAPAVSGGLALLYERYKQLHSGNNPSAGLMKALLCNGATDIGNPGPDYVYGFGWLNLLRSVEMLERENYFQSSVNQSGINNHSIHIPAGSAIASLKVMLYWNDPAAAPLADQALQNDLDLELVTPSGTIVLPYTLNSNGLSVTLTATRGKDRVNNIEQAVIDYPVQGVYTARVIGERIATGGSQAYVVVFDTLSEGMRLNYPAGDDKFQSGDSMYISWEHYGPGPGNLSLEYSTDNGITWNNISDNINIGETQYLWHIPAGIATSEAMIRLSRQGSPLASLSDPFTIIDVPVVSLSPVQCETYLAINWTTVQGADSYEIFLATASSEQRSMGFTSDTSYAIPGLARDTVYYASARAIINGRPGRRGLAVLRTPASGTCTGSISNGDLSLSNVIGLASGRKETSRELGPATPIRITIRNLDDVAYHGQITAGYQINDDPPVINTFGPVTISPVAGLSYVFPGSANFSAVGYYKLTIWISAPGDPVAKNDTLSVVIKQLENDAIDLSNTFSENFDSATAQEHTRRQTGLEGLDRFDFVGSTASGRIRTFLASGIAFSGNRAITLDADRALGGAGNVDSLTGTFNLKNYNASLDDVRLDFQFKHHGQTAHPANQVWVRGSDQSPWLPVYDLSSNQDDPGVFRKSSSLEISDLLFANGQNFTSSFQVKWGQWGQFNATDQRNAAGYTIDDIRIYKVVDDIQMISIDTPLIASCGLNATTPVRVTVRNSANDPISNIPVSFQTGSQAVVTEIIPLIPGNGSVSYTFSQTADLSAIGPYQLKTWVSLDTDDFRDNDSTQVTLRNSPVISQFPYLQDFESGEADWFASGKNSSWEWGTPASVKIRSAASGSKAWKTTLSGNYNDGELSYLYSPCFNLSGLASPMLSFALALDIEDCGASTLCDGAWVEYSTDGRNWQRLGAYGEGVNWYNRNYGTGAVWSIYNYTYWHVASIPLPAGAANLRLRFVMSGDPYVSREGIAVDDIHIYDRTAGIFNDLVTQSNRIEQPVNGNDWVYFNDAGQVLAAVHPHEQDLGSTGIRTYLHNGDVRDVNQTYYLNRNITLQPVQQRPADSVDVRIYFTDNEVEEMRDTESCANCPQLRSAYQLGVAQYTDRDKNNENGTVADNSGTNWNWTPSDRVRIVPFDIGYYAQFRVKQFSEFWLSPARMDNTPAPWINVLMFRAARSNNEVVDLTWWLGELNADYFEVELARGNEAYTQNNFETIGTVYSQGNSNTGNRYSYADGEPGKTGVRYYRLKMRTLDGAVTYSPVRAVVFSSEITWQLYPNPTDGQCWIAFQANEGDKLQAVVYDLHGRALLRKEYTGTGFVQKAEMDLRSVAGSGLYLVQITGPGQKLLFKLVKQ